MRAIPILFSRRRHKRNETRNATFYEIRKHRIIPQFQRRDDWRNGPCLFAFMLPSWNPIAVTVVRLLVYRLPTCLRFLVFLHPQEFVSAYRNDMPCTWLKDVGSFPDGARPLLRRWLDPTKYGSEDVIPTSFLRSLLKKKRNVEAPPLQNWDKQENQTPLVACEQLPTEACSGFRYFGA